MATEFISREATIERFCNVYCGCSPDECGFKIPQDGAEECAAVRALQEIHAADVRPVVRGKWEKHEDFDPYGGGRFVEWVCSECDKRLRGDWATRNHIEETPTENFCPNCGADMREVSEDG